MGPSRGNAISAYSAPFSKGALVYGANIQSGVVTSAHIADGTVVAGDIGAGSITSAKIGTGAVVEVKIGAGAVTSAKIGTGAVVAAKIGAAAVTSAKIGAGAILSAAIAANAVVKAKIRSAVITGTIISSGITYAVAHGLGATPNVVIVSVRDTLAKISAGTNVGESSASARTATNFYIVGRPHGAKYTAYCMI